MQRILLVLCSLLLSVALVMAQAANCPDLVDEALDITAEYCDVLNRNEVCYGNVRLEATAVDEDTELNLDEPGDIESIVAIESLRLSPMQTPDMWGVAMMAVQADIPDTLPGQNVIFVLFGDVTIAAKTDESLSSMQAFTIQTGITGRQCNQAPNDGVLIQSPEGIDKVRFQVNGVDVEFGSTIYLQSHTDEGLRVNALEGNISVTANGQTVPVPPGTRARIPLNPDNTPAALPTLERMTRNDIRGLPLRLLPREVLPPPFIQPEVIEAYTQLNQIALSGSTGIEGGFDIQAIDYNYSIYTEPQFGCPEMANARPGMLIYFGYGVGVPVGESESAAEAEFTGHSGQITVDSIALPTFRQGITLHGGGNYGDRAIAVWIATPGRHNATSVWTHENGPLKSCEFVVNNN